MGVISDIAGACFERGGMASSAHAKDCPTESRTRSTRQGSLEAHRAPSEDCRTLRRGHRVLEGQAGDWGGGTPAELATCEGMTFADASFLVAFFAGGDFHREAVRWWQRTDTIITVSRLVLFEAENSMRTLPLGGKVTREAARHGIEMMKRAILEGLIEVRALRAARVYPHGLRLSAHYAEKRAFGAVDLLHVATALDIGAREFVTFDHNQKELAKTEGLIVAP
jgi:predicted nucleic acid-binding protein